MNKPNAFLKWGVVIVIIFVVILAGLLVYQTVVVPNQKVTPTPSPTIPAWQDKSEKTVNSFLDLWLKSIGATNADQYATQAKAYLTVAAQTQLSGSSLSSQLAGFVDLSNPKSYSIVDIAQIDETHTQVTVDFIDTAATETTKNFYLTSVSGNWLIDSVQNWGED